MIRDDETREERRDATRHDGERRRRAFGLALEVSLARARASAGHTPTVAIGSRGRRRHVTDGGDQLYMA
jgi:hypothetical protein